MVENGLVKLDKMLSLISAASEFKDSGGTLHKGLGTYQKIKDWFSLVMSQPEVKKGLEIKDKLSLINQIYSLGQTAANTSKLALPMLKVAGHTVTAPFSLMLDFATGYYGMYKHAGQVLTKGELRSLQKWRQGLDARYVRDFYTCTCADQKCHEALEYVLRKQGDKIDSSRPNFATAATAMNIYKTSTQTAAYNAPSGFMAKDTSDKSMYWAGVLISAAMPGSKWRLASTNAAAQAAAAAFKSKNKDDNNDSNNVGSTGSGLNINNPSPTFNSVFKNAPAPKTNNNNTGVQSAAPDAFLKNHPLYNLQNLKVMPDGTANPLMNFNAPNAANVTSHNAKSIPTAGDGESDTFEDRAGNSITIIKKGCRKAQAIIAILMDEHKPDTYCPKTIATIVASDGQIRLATAIKG